MHSIHTEEFFDAIIVGTGAAGLYCALNLPERFQILILTKQKAEESDSFLAQGGICMLRGENDYQPYFDDTMRAGHWENDRSAVDLMIRSSNFIFRDLERRGVDFSRSASGALRFTREGAHSKPRILFHEDITGQEITQTLLNEVRQCDNITLYENTTLLDFFNDENACGGVIVMGEDKEVRAIHSTAVVLACGGIGGLYEHSTNFPHITGDAIAMALRHGVKVDHLDCVQIHPTTLYSQKPGRRFLISESVRGEGAFLLNANGERFVDELLPRDVVSEAIYAQMQKDGSHYVLEDLRPIGEKKICEHFPNILQRCCEEGYDPLHEPIPVTPAQHYLMGGIRADLSSRTTMPRLYACGETACNGVHGRNRLASNSLLESLVFAQRAADDIQFSDNAKYTGTVPDLAPYRETEPLFSAYKTEVLDAITQSRTKQSATS